MKQVLLVVVRQFVFSGGSWYTSEPAGPGRRVFYLPYFGSVTVAGRLGDGVNNNLDRMHRIDPRIQVVGLPDMSGIRTQIRRRVKVRQQLVSLIAESDAVIVRVPTELVWRFGRNLTMEIHSTPATALFSYGVIGLTSFLAMLVLAGRRGEFGYWMIIAAPLAYSMTHMGLRFTLFWLLIALIASVTVRDLSRPVIQKSGETKLKPAFKTAGV